jgi:putative transposase
MGSVTAQTILIKNGNAWRGFFRLLELKREGRLPPFISRVNPPGYKKNKSRALWTVSRKDRYKMDGDRIILKGLGAIGWIEVGYKGLIHLRGERGELEIRYDVDRKKWYAHVSFEVSEKAVEGRMEASTTTAEGQSRHGHRHWDQ